MTLAIIPAIALALLCIATRPIRQVLVNLAAAAALAVMGVAVLGSLALALAG